MSYRTYSSHIKSLVHFNYPYYSESGDGLFDDILGFCWTRSGSAKLAGSHAPADLINYGTPKFGYRCLHTESNSDYIHCTLPSGLSLSQLEASMWVRVTASGTGNILQLKNGSTVILTLSVNAENELAVASSSLGLNFTTLASLQLNTWEYVRLQASASTASVSVNNGAIASASMSGSRDAFPTFNAIQLGGIRGQTDEFILRDSFTEGLPSEPEKAICNVNALGGFGTGALGNVTITSNRPVNTYAKAEFASNKAILNITHRVSGAYGDFAAGNEIMLLDMESGAYEFRNISSYTGTMIFVSKAFTISGSSLQVIQVPNFNTLTVNAGAEILPCKWDGSVGGIVAFRVKGNCTINGSIITSGGSTIYGGLVGYDGSMHHSKLVDKFVSTTGGSIMIFCGGTLTVPSSARIGGILSGSRSGYGGDSKLGSFTSSGGVGFGGYAYVTTLEEPEAAHSSPQSGLGNAHGQASGSIRIGSTTYGPCSAGANILIVAKTLNADSEAISTGGSNAPTVQGSTAKAAGSGYCYIACERMI